MRLTRLHVGMLALVCLLLPALLALPSTARPALPAKPTQSLAVLIVSSGSKAQRAKEEQMIALIHQSLDEQGLPREVLPILTYHTNKQAEKHYCEKALNIHDSDLVFLGLAQHKNLVVKRIILRENNVKDATQAVGDLFARAVAVLTGSDSGATATPSPKAQASASPPEEDAAPIESPTPPTTGARIVSAVVCRGVNSYGAANQPTDTFSPRDVFYVSVEMAKLKNGTTIEARWYNGATFIRTSRIVSNKIGDYHAWFRVKAPSGSWPSGSYRVILFVDGQQQATQYFRVNDQD